MANNAPSAVIAMDEGTGADLTGAVRTGGDRRW